MAVCDIFISVTALFCFFKQETTTKTTSCSGSSSSKIKYFYIINIYNGCI